MGPSLRHPGFARVVGLLLVCLMGLGGCGFGGPGQPEVGPDDRGPQNPGPRTTGSDSADEDAVGGGAAEDLRQDVDTAVSSTAQFWSRHWSELFTGNYVQPRIHGFYDGDNPAAGPFCGSQPPVPLNAFYCPAEDLIAWDVDLMTMLFAEGDASVYLVIAHEWGHAIQQRLSAELVTLDAELQADCLAGASLYGSAADGTILFEQGDQEELARILAALADRTAWTDVGDHGSASQRIGAFASGGQGGVAACLPVR